MASKKSGRMRELGAGILVVLACLMFLVATPAVWAHRNFLDTDRFVSRAAPLVEDPAVQTALADRLTVELMTLVNPKKLFEEVLPDRGQILAAPLANAVQGFVHDQVQTFIESDAFQTLWRVAITKAHATAVAVLRGDTTVLETANGVVKLNLVPLIDAILSAISAASPDLLGRNLEIPSVEDLSNTSDPNSAINRLSDALGIKLDSNFGQLVVYDRDQLSTAQEAVELFDRFVIPALILSIVFAAGAIALSHRRRRTIILLCIGVILGMVLLRRASFLLEDDVTGLPPTEAGRAAAVPIISAFIDPLQTFALYAAWIALFVILIAAVTSSGRRAVALRERVTVLAKRVKDGTVDAAGDRVRPTWVDEHFDLLRVGGVVVGLLALWVLDLSWFGLLLLIVAVSVYEAVLHRMAPPGADDDAGADDSAAPDDTAEPATATGAGTSE
jgi:hypothetical protein